MYGIPVILKLLHPAIKNFIETLKNNKGSYLGINELGARLYIDGNPIIDVKSEYVDAIKECCDDVKEYQDINEYRVSLTKAQQLLNQS